MPELVALDMPAGPGLVDSIRRIWDRGDAVTPVDSRLPKASAEALLRELRPGHVVHDNGEESHLAGGLPVDDGDALVIATSGSAGDPRGVVLSHEALRASAEATAERLSVDAALHTWLCCLPVAHIGGFSVISRALLSGTPLMVLPGFDGEEVNEVGRQGKATHVSLVETALRRMNPSLFSKILLGGAAAPGDLPENVVVTYGMTETGSGIAYDGRPLRGVDVAIDAEGEILVRGPMLLRSYRDGTDPRTIGPDMTPGWLRTGDWGRFDEDGLLHVSGRIAEIIVTGGEKVWPESVERVLSTDPRVADVGVWKREDPEWGERVVAWIVPKDRSEPPTLESLKELALEQLGPWAAPKELVVVEELPRTPSGKLRRRLLA